MKSRSTTIHIADSQPLLRHGIIHLLTEAKFAIVGQSECAREMETAVSSQQPDLLIADLPNLAGDGWGGLTHIKQATPKTKLIILTTSPDPFCLTQAILNGAIACLDKQIPAAKLVESIDTAIRGLHLFSPQLLQMALADADPYRHRQLAHLDHLTPSEQKILSLLGRGYNNKTIAQQLDISTNTVKTHLRHLFKKLKVADRTQAAVWAVTHNLTHLGDKT